MFRMTGIGQKKLAADMKVASMYPGKKVPLLGEVKKVVFSEMVASIYYICSVRFRHDASHAKKYESL